MHVNDDRDSLEPVTLPNEPPFDFDDAPEEPPASSQPPFHFAVSKEAL